MVLIFWFFHLKHLVNSFHHPRDGWFCPGTNVCLENIFMSASTIDEEASNSNMLISHRLAVPRSTSSSEGESGTQHLPSGVHHLYLRIFVLPLTRAMWCWPRRHKPPGASRWKTKQTAPIEYYLRPYILADRAAFCSNLAELGLLPSIKVNILHAGKCCNAAPYVVTGDERRAACCCRSNECQRAARTGGPQLGRNHGESADLCPHPVLHWNLQDPETAGTGVCRTGCDFIEVMWN